MKKQCNKTAKGKLWHLKERNDRKYQHHTIVMSTQTSGNYFITLTATSHLSWRPGPGSSRRCRVPRRSTRTPHTPPDSWCGRAGWCSGGSPDTDHCPSAAVLRGDKQETLNTAGMRWNLKNWITRSIKHENPQSEYVQNIFKSMFHSFLSLITRQTPIDLLKWRNSSPLHSQLSETGF